jgi:serine/threonine-protein kinase
MSPRPAIAHYRITAKLGEGGMGEVWRATDTKLNREVAIKILPEAFANDADRMARFGREAQVLASLNHPNIAVIHGVEERALVMELVEGPTLADHIARGAIPVEEALPIAKQIAEALEYAHERGIVHRDLKPANIKITPEGRVKVLDFGLAKAMSGESAPADPASSPTLTMRGTQMGVIMGTAAYMSPEQARGQVVDRRTDIWSFGAVLYEMLTGRRLFSGATVSDTLAGVLKGDLDLKELPLQIRPVVERCMRRDMRLRWRSIGDVSLMLEEGAPAAPSVPARRSRLPWAVAAGVLTFALCVAAAGWWRAVRPVDRPLTRLSVDLGPDALTGLNLTCAISPDGRRLVFPARSPDGRQQLATRLLDQAEATLLPGTEGGSDPFFSPDGQWIGFNAPGQLRKILVQSGAPVALASATDPTLYGGSWGDDAGIVASFGTILPLGRISAAGGTAQALTKFGPGEVSHRWPQILPGGVAVLFTASPSVAAWDDANIETVSLKTGQVKIVQRGGYYGRYLPSGHLVYVHQGTLFGVKFDLSKLEAQGGPVPILQDVAANPATGGGQFDFSWGPFGHGTFVYAAGKSAAQSWQVGWLDSAGKTQPLISTPGPYTGPRASPDGRKLAFENRGDIFLYDVDRDTTSRLTFTGSGGVPVWAPDSKHLVFQSGANGLSWVRSDGSGDPQHLLAVQGTTPIPWSFSPDGRRLAYHETSGNGFDIWTLPLDLSDPEHPKPGKPEPFLRTPANERRPRFSPDGRWIAYASNESGSNEIYVRPFPAGVPPGSGGKWQISSGGGLYAFWSKDTHELFYETADNRIMAVDYSINGDSFVAGKPRAWYDKPLFYPGSSNLDLAPNGKRFAVFTLPGSAPGTVGSVHVTMLFNFFDELRRRIP